MKNMMSCFREGEQDGKTHAGNDDNVLDCPYVLHGNDCSHGDLDSFGTVRQHQEQCDELHRRYEREIENE